MINVINGNILDATEKYICHQVNCRNAMGSGLARQFFEKWPQVKAEYHAVTSVFAVPNDLLGMFYNVRVGKDQFVVNVYGQLDYGVDKTKVYTSYTALETAFTSMAEMLHGDFAFPYGFGCGLANGDWNTVFSLIKKCFDKKKVTIYKL